MSHSYPPQRAATAIGHTGCGIAIGLQVGAWVERAITVVRCIDYVYLTDEY